MPPVMEYGPQPVTESRTNNFAASSISGPAVVGRKETAA